MYKNVSIGRCGIRNLGDAFSHFVVPLISQMVCNHLLFDELARRLELMNGVLGCFVPCVGGLEVVNSACY